MTRKRRWMQGAVRRPGKLHEDIGVSDDALLTVGDILVFMEDVTTAMDGATGSRRAGLRRQLQRANTGLDFRRYRGWRPKVGAPYRSSVSAEK